METQFKLPAAICLALGIAASLPFVANAREYEAAGTLCDPINVYAPNSERLRKFNGEIRNIDSTGGTVGVVCPVLTGPSNAFHDIYVGVRNTGDASASFDCTLHEVSDGVKVNSWFESAEVAADASVELAWEGVDVSALANIFYVDCKLPPRGAVRYIQAIEPLVIP